MVAVKSSAIRLLAGLVTFLVISALIEFPFRGAVPLPGYIILGFMFSIAFLLFGRPIVVGFSLRPRVLPSYFVSASIIAVVVCMLFLIRDVNPG